MHDFDDSLAASHAASDLPLWEECYRKFFPTFAAMVDHRQDGDHQRAGIDRSVLLANSKQMLIDEKVRWRNKLTGKIYDDIALEYLSNDRRGIPGWVCKPLLADYIAYAIAPLGKCYLLPVVQLQLAWCRCGNHWIEKFGGIRAENRGYCTVSVGVPVADVFRELGGALRCAFDPVEDAITPKSKKLASKTIAKAKAAAVRPSYPELPPDTRPGPLFGTQVGLFDEGPP